MSSHLDWNCGLYPRGLDGMVAPSYPGLYDGLTVLRDRFNIKRFCFSAVYDPGFESVNAHLLRRDRTEKKVQELLAGTKIKMKMMSVVPIAPNLGHVPDLDCLYMFGGTHLPIVLPLYGMCDWLDLELNSLLYKYKHKLFFTSFDRTFDVYPREFVEKCIRIPKAVFQISFQSLSNKSFAYMVRAALREKIPFLLGSELQTGASACFYEFDYYMQKAEQYLSREALERLLELNYQYWLK